MASNGYTPPRFAVSSKIEAEMSRGLDVWTVFSPASGYMPKDALNLGQGFMSWAPPQFAREAVKEALPDPSANHYSIPRGRVRLRNAISKYYSPSFGLGRPLNPDTEILCTPGANFGIYLTLLAFIEPGDEVIVFEPFFDQYIPNIRLVGGTPVYVSMRPPPNAAKATSAASEWTIDPDDFRKAITPKTRAVIINSPQNPTGKVMTAEEMRELGKIAEEHNLLIISDEVYDVLAFEPSRHIRLASLEHFWHRTITVASAGKAFAATGWRVGYLMGPEQLIKPCLAGLTRTTFTTNSPLQEAVAAGLEVGDEFFAKQREEYIERRAHLMAALDELGLPYTIPDGAYFILVEISRIEIPADFEILDVVKNKTKDWHAAWFIAKTCGVVSIPPTDFYCDEHAHIGSNFLRLAFCKDTDVLDDAGKRLLKLRPYIRSTAS